MKKKKCKMPTQQKAPARPDSYCHPRPRRGQIPASRPNAPKSLTTRSTLVDSALQINLFMQNKANFRKAKMSITLATKKPSENNQLFRCRQNKPNLSRRSFSEDGFKYSKIRNSGFIIRHLSQNCLRYILLLTKPAGAVIVANLC